MPELLDMGLDPVAHLSADVRSSFEVLPRYEIEPFLETIQTAVADAGLAAEFDFPSLDGDPHTLRAELSRLRTRVTQNAATAAISQRWMSVSDRRLRGYWFSLFSSNGEHIEVDAVYPAGSVHHVITSVNTSLADTANGNTSAGGSLYRLHFPHYRFLGDGRPGATFRITSLSIVLSLTLTAPPITVMAATTGPWSLATTGGLGDGGNPTFIMDDVIGIPGDHVLIKDNPAVENGVYVFRKIVSGRAGFFTFELRWDRVPVNLHEALVAVRNGATNALKLFRQTTPNPVIGTSPIVFVEVAGGVSAIARPTRIEFAGQVVNGVVSNVNPDTGFYLSTHTFTVPIVLTGSPADFNPVCLVDVLGSVPNGGRSIFITIENIVPDAIGNASGGEIFRVLSHATADWRRLRCPEVRMQRTSDNADMPILDALHLARTAEDTEALAYWRSSSRPASYHLYNVLCSSAELWRSVAGFPGLGAAGDFITNPDGLIQASEVAGLSGRQAIALAPLAHVKPPHARSISKIYSGAERQNANWPDYDLFNLTVPQTWDGRQIFNLAEIRFGVEPPFLPSNSIDCYFMKIPLPGISKEQIASTRWNNLQIDQSLAKTFEIEVGYGSHPEFKLRTIGEGIIEVNGSGSEWVPPARGTPAADYFHDARVTTRDGNTFWYRDLFTVLAGDLDHVFRRVPLWTIQEDGADLALYLLQPVFPIRFGNLPGDIREVGYAPSGTVTAEEYRDSYQRWGDIWTGNWNDFQAPWRFFGIDPVDKSPVAVWQINKAFRSVWTHGEELTLHIPKIISRTPCFNFHIQTRYALDATVARQQWLALFVPGAAGPTRHTEIKDVETIRSDRHFGMLVFRNGVAYLNLHVFAAFDFPDNPNPPTNGLAEDLHLFVAGIGALDQSTVSYAGAFDAYELEALNGFRDCGAAGFMNWEINPGDYTYEPSTGKITLHRTDAIHVQLQASRPVPLPADEFVYAWVSFRTRYGRRPRLDIVYGNLTGNGYPFTFNDYRKQIIGDYSVTATVPFYFNDYEGVGNAISQPWIRAENWPLFYRKQQGSGGITTDYTAEQYVYTVGGLATPGLLVRYTPNQDIRLRYLATWRGVWFKTYAELKAEYSSPTWTPFATSPQAGGYIESGTHFPWIPVGTTIAPNVVRFYTADSAAVPSLAENYSPAFGPQLVLTLGGLEPDDATIIRVFVERNAITEIDLLEGTHFIPPRVGTDVIALRQRLCFFSPVRVEQRYDVRSVWTESMGVVTGNEVRGIPESSAANETLRLVESYNAVGRP